MVSQILLKTGRFHVLVGSYDFEKGKAAIEKIAQEEKASSSFIEPLELDLSSDSSIREAAEYVKSKFGRLDVLVNNAGVARPPKYGTIRE